jgi:hypothetical protein
MAQIAVEVGVLGLVVPSCKKHHLLQNRGTRQLGRNHHHHHGCVVYKACYSRKRIAVVCSQQQKGPANTKNNAAAATKVAEKAILEERSIPAAGPLSGQPLQQQEVRCCCSVSPLSLADCSFPDIMLEWNSSIVC